VKAIIFGANGQDANYLASLLRARSIDVIGISRSLGNLKGNVADLTFVESLIKNIIPDYVFHFAANSSTAHEALFDNHQAISSGTLNILEAVRRHSQKTKVFLAGSAMQFRNDGNPISEITPFEANSPYSVARIHSTYAGRYYRERFGIAVYCGYLFNHDSPIRAERHINQKIVKAVKRIANGSDEKLEIGDLYVEKEFNYAGDIIEAVWILINQDAIYEAVIGCGETHTIKEWLDYCFGKISKDWKDFVVINRNHKSEYRRLVSNPTLLLSLGWSPKMKLHELAELMLNS